MRRCAWYGSALRASAQVAKVGRAGMRVYSTRVRFSSAATWSACTVGLVDVTAALEAHQAGPTGEHHAAQGDELLVALPLARGERRVLEALINEERHRLL